MTRALEYAITPTDPTEIGYVDGATSNLQNQLNNATSFNGATVYNSLSFSVANNTTTAVTFNSEGFDTDSIHSTSTNPSRLTVPSGVTKVKLITAGEFAANNSGNRLIYIDKNNLPFEYSPFYREASPDGTLPTTFNLSTPVIPVSGGDYFELKVYQNSGGSLNISSNVWFSMEIIE